MTAKGYLLSIDDDGKPQEENIKRYLEADLLDDFGFSEWVGPEPHGLGKHNTGTVKDVFTADETVELLQRLDGDESDRAVADGLLVPQPARRLDVRSHRADAGTALPPFDRAAHRAGADARGRPVDQAGLPAEHGRPVGNDPGAAAVDRDAPEVLLPAAGDGRRADHQGARRAGGERRLREHDRGLHVGSRRPAGRAQRDAREVARRLRGGAACAVRRVQPASARRRSRARRADEPRRPDPDPARPGRDRSGRGPRQG